MKENIQQIQIFHVGYGNSLNDVMKVKTKSLIL